MTDPQSGAPDPAPPPPTDPAVRPGLARARLPFESDEAIKRRSAGVGVSVLYATGAIALAGLSGYMAIVQRVEPTDMRVWAPALVAIWFVARAVMVAARGNRD